MSQPRTPRRPATYDDLLALPDHVVGEIVDGELFVSPRPAPRHSIAASAIGMDVGPPFHHGRGGPGGWWIIFEPELHLNPGSHLTCRGEVPARRGQPRAGTTATQVGNRVSADVVVPDIAGWQRPRMPAVPETAYFAIPPDWVCEVLSPATARLDRHRKLGVYADAGVSHAWLVDPIARTLEVLRLADGRWVIDAIHAGDDQIQAPPFGEITLALSQWWVD